MQCIMGSIRESYLVLLKLERVGVAPDVVGKEGCMN